MKIRTDFVTNSSSSSFIIAKKHLDSDQLEAIRNHGKLAKKLGLDSPEWAWNIDENGTFITGDTCMDNFDMEEFLSIIEVPMEYVHWGEYSFNVNQCSLSEYGRKNSVNYADEEEQEEQSWRDLL